MNRTSRIADNGGSGSDISRDDATGADNRIVFNGDTGKDDRSIAEKVKFVKKPPKGRLGNKYKFVVRLPHVWTVGIEQSGNPGLGAKQH